MRTPSVHMHLLPQTSTLSGLVSGEYDIHICPNRCPGHKQLAFIFASQVYALYLIEIDTLKGHPPASTLQLSLPEGDGGYDLHILLLL